MLIKCWDGKWGNLSHTSPFLLNLLIKSWVCSSLGFDDRFQEEISYWLNQVIITVVNPYKYLVKSHHLYVCKIQHIYPETIYRSHWGNSNCVFLHNIFMNQDCQVLCVGQGEIKSANKYKSCFSKITTNSILKGFTLTVNISGKRNIIIVVNTSPSCWAHYCLHTQF